MPARAGRARPRAGSALSLLSRALLGAEPQPARPALSESLRAADAAEIERDGRLEAERLAFAMNAVALVEAQAGRAGSSVESAEALMQLKTTLDWLFRLKRPAPPRKVDLAALERAVRDPPPGDPPAEPPSAQGDAQP